MIDLENDFESKEILVYRKIALKEIEIEQSHRPQSNVSLWSWFIGSSNTTNNNEENEWHWSEEMKKELYESYESSLKNKSYWEICLENDMQRSIYVYCPSINVKLFKDNLSDNPFQLTLHHISYYANHKQSTQETWGRLFDITLQNSSNQMIITGSNSNSDYNNSNISKTPFIFVHQNNPNNDSTAHSVEVNVGELTISVLFDDYIFLYNYFVFPSPIYGLTNTLLSQIYLHLREDYKEMKVYKKSYNQLQLKVTSSSIIISIPELLHNTQNSSYLPIVLYSYSLIYEANMKILYDKKIKNLHIDSENQLTISSLNLSLFNKDFVIQSLVPSNSLIYQNNCLFIVYCNSISGRYNNNNITYYTQLQLGYISLLANNQNKLLTIGSEKDNFSLFFKMLIIKSLQNTLSVDARINNIIFTPKPYPEIFYYQFHRNVEIIYKFVNNYQKRKRDKLISKKHISFQNINVNYIIESLTVLIPANSYSLNIKLTSSSNMIIHPKISNKIYIELFLLDCRRIFYNHLDNNNEFEYIIKPCGFYLTSELSDSIHFDITFEGSDKLDILINECDLSIMKKLIHDYIPDDVFQQRYSSKRKHNNNSNSNKVSSPSSTSSPSSSSSSPKTFNRSNSMAIPIETKYDKSSNNNNNNSSIDEENTSNTTPILNTPGIPTFNQFIPIINRYSNVIVTLTLTTPGIVIQYYPTLHIPLCISISEVVMSMTQSRSLNIFCTLACYYYNANHNIYEPFVDKTPLSGHCNIESLANTYQLDVVLNITDKININITDALIHSLTQDKEKNYKYRYYNIEPNMFIHVDNQLNIPLYYSLSELHSILHDFQKEIKFLPETRISKKIYTSIGLINRNDYYYIVSYTIDEFKLLITNYMLNEIEEYEINKIDWEDDIIHFHCIEKGKRDIEDKKEEEENEEEKEDRRDDNEEKKEEIIIDIKIFDFQDISSIIKNIIPLLETKEKPLSTSIIKPPYNLNPLSDIVKYKYCPKSDWQLINERQIITIPCLSYPSQSLESNYYNNRKLLFTYKSANNNSNEEEGKEEKKEEEESKEEKGYVANKNISVGLDNNQPSSHILRYESHQVTVFSSIDTYPDGKVLTLSGQFIIVNHCTTPMKVTCSIYQKKTSTVEMVIQPQHSCGMHALYNKTNTAKFEIENGIFRRSIGSYIQLFDQYRITGNRAETFEELITPGVNKSEPRRSDSSSDYSYSELSLISSLMEEDYSEITSQRYVSVEVNRITTEGGYQLYKFIFSPIICIENGFLYPLNVRIAHPKTREIIAQYSILPEQKIPLLYLKSFSSAAYQVSISCPELVADYSPFTDDSKVSTKLLKKNGICELFSSKNNNHFILKLKWTKKLFTNSPYLKIITPVMLLNHSGLKIYSVVYKHSEKKSVFPLESHDIEVYSRNEYEFPDKKQLLNNKNNICLCDFLPKTSNQLFSLSLDKNINLKDIKPLEIKDIKNSVQKYTLRNERKEYCDVLLSCRKGPGIYSSCYIISIQSLFAVFNNNSIPIEISSTDSNKENNCLIQPHHCYQHYKQEYHNSLIVKNGNNEVYKSNYLNHPEISRVIRLYNYENKSKIYCRLTYYSKIGTNVLDVNICNKIDSSTIIHNLLPNYYVYIVENNLKPPSFDPGQLLFPYQQKHYSFYSSSTVLFDIYLYPINVELDEKINVCSDVIYHYKYDVNKQEYEYISTQNNKKKSPIRIRTDIQLKLQTIFIEPLEYSHDNKVLKNVIDNYTKQIFIIKNEFKTRDIPGYSNRNNNDFKDIIIDILQIKGFLYNDYLICKIISKENSIYSIKSDESGLFYFSIVYIEEFVDRNNNIKIIFENKDGKIVLDGLINIKSSNSILTTKLNPNFEPNQQNNCQLIPTQLYYRLIRCDNREKGIMEMKQLQANYQITIYSNIIRNSQKLLRTNFFKMNCEPNIQDRNVSIKIPVICVSFIDNKPQEVASVVLTNFNLHTIQSTTLTIESQIDSIEIADNRQNNKLYPILLHKNMKFSEPFFKLSCSYLNNNKFKKIHPVIVCMNWEFIVYIIEYIKSLNIMDMIEEDSFHKLLIYSDKHVILDPISFDVAYIMVETFRIEEIKATFSCSIGNANIELLLKREPFWGKYLSTLSFGGALLGNIKSSSLSFSAFDNRNVYCTSAHIYRTLQKYYLNEIKRSLLRLGASLSLIGNPMGLVESIGEGVQDFKSELDDFRDKSLIGKTTSITRGTSKLLKSTAKGLLNTVDVLTDGLSSALNNSITRSRDQSSTIPPPPPPPPPPPSSYLNSHKVFSHGNNGGNNGNRRRGSSSDDNNHGLLKGVKSIFARDKWVKTLNTVNSYVSTVNTTYFGSDEDYNSCRCKRIIDKNRIYEYNENECLLYKVLEETVKKYGNELKLLYSVETTNNKLLGIFTRFICLVNKSLKEVIKIIPLDSKYEVLPDNRLKFENQFIVRFSSSHIIPLIVSILQYLQKYDYLLDDEKTALLYQWILNQNPN